MNNHLKPPALPDQPPPVVGHGALNTVTENFGVSRSVMLSAALLIFVVIICGVFWFIHSAPPDTVVITSGPEGSVFQTNAIKYASILARNGVKLKILPSQGSQENLLRLNNPAFHVDVGFVQGGMTGGITVSNLVSLGSIAYQPLFVFYRSTNTVELLSEFNGKRLAVGQLGSGTRSLAMTLLQTNGVGGATVMLDIPPAEASKALLDGNADAVFLMGDSASMTIMRKLLRTPGIHLFNFKQAAAYTRRLNYLNILTFPMGSIDLGNNIPPRDANLLGPTVELITRKTLHPAMSDLLLEAAREVHSRASILQRRGEFPAPLEQEFPISEDAARFYKSGKSFLYRYLPFSLASLINRIVMVFLPMIVVLVPGLRTIPKIYRWRIRSQICRWYRALLALEHELPTQTAPGKREYMLKRLDHIERTVHNMKVPASFADQFYALRGHIDFVRNRLAEEVNSAEPPSELGRD